MNVIKIGWSISFAILLTLLLLVIVGLGLADGETVYHACVNNSSGTIFVVSGPEDCKTNETYITWNQQGPEGSQGPSGVDGVDGAPGADGLPGPPGPAGVDGVDGTDGLNCWDANGDGIQDTVEDVNGDGLWDALDCQGPPGPEGPQGASGNLTLAGQNCVDGFVTGFDSNGDITCSSGNVPSPLAEVCDGIDNDGDGQIDEDLIYCSDGVPAPNTDGSACLAGFYDVYGGPTDGCESPQQGELGGIWQLDQEIHYTCGLDFQISSVYIEDTSPNIAITGLGNVPFSSFGLRMEGTIDATGDFTVINSSLNTGEDYQMTGSFNSDSAFSATLSVSSTNIFCGEDRYNIIGFRLD